MICKIKVERKIYIYITGLCHSIIGCARFFSDEHFNLNTFAYIRHISIVFIFNQSHACHLWIDNSFFSPLSTSKITFSQPCSCKMYVIVNSLAFCCHFIFNWLDKKKKIFVYEIFKLRSFFCDMQIIDACTRPIFFFTLLYLSSLLKKKHAHAHSLLSCSAFPLYLSVFICLDCQL